MLTIHLSKEQCRKLSVGPTGCAVVEIRPSKLKSLSGRSPEYWEMVPVKGRAILTRSTLDGPVWFWAPEYWEIDPDTMPVTLYRFSGKDPIHGDPSLQYLKDELSQTLLGLGIKIEDFGRHLW